MKLDSEYFLRALNRFNLKAEECFFVDDVPSNVEGAVYCGMSGAVFYSDAALLRQEFKNAGVTL